MPDDDALTDWLLWQLLRRHGLISRDLLAAERLPFRWGRLYAELRRLEYTGEVRRGHFVTGLAGAQFALPEVVEELRRLRDAPPSEEPVLISACDPALLPRLATTVWPWAHGFARVPSAHLVLEDGRPALWTEQHGRRVHVAPGLEPDVLARALRCLTGLAERPAVWRPTRQLEVESIDGEAALGAPLRPAFEAAGYRARGAVLRFGQ